MLRSEMIGPDWRLGRALTWLRASGALVVAAFVLLFVALLLVLQNRGIDFSDPINLFESILIASAGILSFAFAIIIASFGGYWLFKYARRERDDA